MLQSAGSVEVTPDRHLPAGLDGIPEQRFEIFSKDHHVLGHDHIDEAAAGRKRQGEALGAVLDVVDLSLDIERRPNGPGDVFSEGIDENQRLETPANGRRLSAVEGFSAAKSESATSKSRTRKARSAGPRRSGSRKPTSRCPRRPGRAPPPR